jgi:hypothetical protein
VRTGEMAHTWFASWSGWRHDWGGCHQRLARAAMVSGANIIWFSGEMKKKWCTCVGSGWGSDATRGGARGQGVVRHRWQRCCRAGEQQHGVACCRVLKRLTSGTMHSVISYLSQISNYTDFESDQKILSRTWKFSNKILVYRKLNKELILVINAFVTRGVTNYVSYLCLIVEQNMFMSNYVCLIMSVCIIFIWT